MSDAVRKRNRSGPEILRDRLVRHLRDDVWARIGPSPKHGVGVVAIRDIKKGQIVDRVPGECLPPALRRTVHSSAINVSELGDVPEEVRSYLQEMYVCSNGMMDVCSFGFNSFIGLGHFVNHSAEPNVSFTESPPDDITDVGMNMKVVAVTDIAKGEELLCDYREYLSREEWATLPGMSEVIDNDDAADAARAAAAGEAEAAGEAQPEVPAAGPMDVDS